MIVLAIASTALRRFFRDRSNYFFVFVMPLAIIILIGAQFGGGFAPTIGVVSPSDGTVETAVVEALDAIPEYDLALYEDADTLADAVSRGGVNAGVVIPEGFDAGVAGGLGPELGFVSRPDSLGPAIRAAVEGAVTEALGPAGAAATVASIQSVSFDEARAFTDAVASQIGEVGVASRTTGDSLFGTNLGQFDVGASSQLVLFMFLTALSGSAALIQSRQLGVTTRMLGTSASAGTIVLGEAVGRLSIAVFQGAYIALVTLFAFQVNWGDITGVIAVLLAFGLVGAGAAMLMGAIFSNDQQAGGVSVVVALGMAALGGSMVPMEIFSPTMQTIARFTPHAWANEAFADLVRHDASLVDILPQIGVLLAIAAVLLTVASWQLRRVITRG
jgi:ABC-2 type transport system permease protein